MPELPEVETIRRQLDDGLRGKTIARIELLRSERETPRGRKFVRTLQGCVVERIERRAKLLIWKFKGGGALVAHLKMTGKFVFAGRDYAPGKHDRAIFEFESSAAAASRARRSSRQDTTRLVWSDVRQFGFLRVVNDAELNRLLAAYGPEPLEASGEELAARLERPKTRTVKAALLDQATIAGVGNIYADEALHRAGLRPTRRLGRLTASDRLRLAREIQNVLCESIARRGTSASDYVDARGEKGGFLSSLRVYGRAGSACRKCNTPVKRIVLGQRGTHYCPECQE